MSYRLQDQFWTVDLSGVDQLVAQRLAWHAKDEDPRCWPGLASLSKSTGLSTRAVQNAIKSLDLAGHITRDLRPGLGTVYTIHPRTTCAGPEVAESDLAQGGNPKAATGARRASPTALAENGGARAADAPPPHVVHPRTSCTPAPDASDPRTSCVQTGHEQGNTTIGGGRDARSSIERVTGQVGRRMEPEWAPTRPLPDVIAKAVAGWPPGRLGEILDEFRDHWISEPGKEASKRDWDRTWWNRLRTIIRWDRDRKASRHGRADRTGGGPLNPMAAAAARALAGSDG